MTATNPGQRHSIVWRIISLMTALAVVLSIVPPTLSALQTVELIQSAERQQEAFSMMMAQDMERWLIADSMQMMITSLRYQKTIGSIVLGRVVYPKGAALHVRADTDDAMLGVAITNTFLTQAFSQFGTVGTNVPFLKRSGVVDGQAITEFALPIKLRGALRVLVLHLGFSRTEITRLQRELVIRCASGVFFSLGICGVLWLVLRGSVTKPLSALISDIEAIGQGTRREVGIVGRDDEMTLLARSFNTMLAELRLKQALERQLAALEQEVTDRQTYLNQLQYFGFWIAHDLEKQLLKLPPVAPEMTDASLWSRLVQYLGNTCDRLKSVSRETETINASIARAERFDIAPLVRETVESYRAQHPDVAFDLDVERSPVIINGDAYLLNACLTNLLNNALDAVRSTGRPGRIATHISTKGPRLSLSVTDNGCGMDLVHTDLRNRIFMPFFSTKVKSGDENRLNSGLGLHFLNEIVVAHRGIVNVESQPGIGTTFELSLPLCGSKEST